MPQAAPALHRFARKGFSLEKAIKFFFASNAGLTIVILVLIIVFLLKEGLGFFPGYRRELEVYRIAGLEFVDLSRKNLTAHEQLASVLNRAYFAEINGKCVRELKRSQEAAALFNAFSDQTSATRDLLVNNLNAGLDPSSEMLATLRENHAINSRKALAQLPATPHLTAAERAGLIDSLRTREVTATEDPPFVATLAAAYAAAQQQHAEPLAELRATIDAFESTSEDLTALVSAMTMAVTATKEAIQNADILDQDRKTLLAAAANAKHPADREKLTAAARTSLAAKPDLAGPMQALMRRKPACLAAHTTLRQACAGILNQLPATLSQPEAEHLLRAARKATPVFLAGLDQAPRQINQWRHDTPVPLTAAIRSFLTGKDWVTGGEWQDFYGILPLLVGSLMISLVALSLAIPAGVGAAIYINQFASPIEQAIVKPVIEFIQAIPSVVLGFIGILVFGTVLRDLSQLDSLAWVPGFPIEERLNIFTAGCLLALMSIPTIFSLAEDALNNVPSAYAEASDALGASRIQTSFRVIIPAAFSGILAAVLLGLGRVIGETMVVLLVAGNRIKIPDFSSGIGAFLQPSHTLTGIIAQELGEVPMGSVHYRALFVVGILLFVIVLAINATAHKFVGRTQP
ncbi:MAG: phosphate ABC transporter permease subunit PstC [Verrucomicrobia bacterium]|nr:phosphate ABC transporter permease subunit PstC [Verrucomicrobiota bacterium]